MSRSFWSCHSRVAATPEDSLYGDVFGGRYEYDSHVINHRQVSVGDVLVIRDRHLIYGYGVVEDIATRAGTKDMQRCVNAECRSAAIQPRKSRLPRFRCNDCHAEFDDPVMEKKDVTLYSASYETWWLPFASPAPVRALDGVYAGRDRQNAIRRLDTVEAHAMLRFHAGLDAELHLQLLDRARPIAGGHVDALVKRRIGQQRFRERLLDRYGATCAVTGSQPDAVLDAAHLYTYAERPVHEEDGGLLLRADVHRMFDRLLITFDPATWRSRVAPGLLARHDRLQVMEDQPIVVPDRLRPAVALVERHHRAARERWREDR